MKLKKRYWAAAFAFSLAVHAGAAAVLMLEDHDDVQVAGGERFEIAVLGNAFEDAVSAGVESATVEPLETTPQETEPLQPATAEPVAPATPETVPPVPEMAAVQPVAPDQTVAIAPSETAETPAPEAPEAPAEQPLDPETAAETEVEETVAALVHVPVPTARPVEPAEEVKPVEQKPVEPVKEAKKSEPRKQERAERREQKAPPKRRQAGNGGNAQADARKGQADGAERGSRVAAGRSGNSREAGNAAVSNYPGKVVTKLRRALRYPAQARRERLRGEVQVSFTVGGGGGVSGIRVVRSSGSPVLDQAALETVRRAAPFPPIPDGRPNWSFTVPLAFTR